MAKIVNLQTKKEFSFSSYASIGRASKSSLSIKDRKLSRLHCEIIKVDSQFILIDLCSQNGTSLNESNISESLLNDGDVITVGKSKVIFHLDSNEQENKAIIKDYSSYSDDKTN